MSTEASQVLIYFVYNTSSQGAFIVCNNSDDNLTYTVYELPDDAVTLEISTQDSHDVNRCNVLMYDIEKDGLLRNSTDLRPAYKLQDSSCIIPRNF